MKTTTLNSNVRVPSRSPKRETDKVECIQRKNGHKRGGPDRSLRLRMLRATPLCHWCGVKLLMGFIWYGGNFDRVATIDHVYPKGHPSPRKDRKLIVLACYRCNQDRNMIHTEFQKIRRALQGGIAA